MMARYRISQKVTMQWYIEAQSLAEARELALDLDESMANTITTDRTVVRVSSCEAHAPMEVLKWN